MADVPAPKSFAALTQTSLRIKLVDIGANPIEGDPPYASLLAEGWADVVGFEPNPEALAKLDKIKGPHERYLPHAVGDGGRHTLRFCQAPGMTSLLEPNPAVLNLFHGFPDWGKVLSTEEIDTVRLDDIPETEGIEYIKIDIQGGELMALSNAENRLKSTLVIQTEVEFMPMYVGQPLFSEMEMFLRGHGFMLHRFFPAVTRMVKPLMMGGDMYAGLNQLLWADAVFVRDLTRLDVLSDVQLLKMAKILHDCYQAIDLAFNLLTEYDRRNQTGLAGGYLNGLKS